MGSVFVLHHVHELAEDEEDVKLIGCYSTVESARTAIERLSIQPGFRDHVDGFSIDEHQLDEDSWTEGFVTVLGDEPDQAPER